MSCRSDHFLCYVVFIMVDFTQKIVNEILMIRYWCARECLVQNIFIMQYICQYRYHHCLPLPTISTRSAQVVQYRILLSSQTYASACVSTGCMYRSIISCQCLFIWILKFFQVLQCHRSPQLNWESLLNTFSLCFVKIQ